MTMELDGRSTTVNAVDPGEISTPMTGAEDTDPSTIGRPNIPPGRPGHAREISHFVAFLTSEKGSYATGSSSDVDGGLTLIGAQMGAGLASRRSSALPQSLPARRLCGRCRPASWCLRSL